MKMLQQLAVYLTFIARKNTNSIYRLKQLKRLYYNNL